MTEALWAAEHLTLTYGTQVLYRDAEFAVHENERLALVGRNGAGKSTLLRLITGEELADEGSQITVRRDMRLGLLPQVCTLNQEASIRENLSGGLAGFRELQRKFEVAPLHSAEYELLEAEINRHDAWHLDNKLNRILEKLHLTGRADTPVRELSGGEQRRVAFGRAIIAEPDLLLLDEPTNHLDVETIEWIEDFLADYRGSCLFVTHDRCFLDRIATGIIELDHGKFYRYEGSYADFLCRKSEREEREDVMEAKRRHFLRTEIDWVRRSPKARLRRNLGRLRRFEEIEAQSAPERDRDVELVIPPPPRLGNLVVTMKDVSFHYPDGRDIIRHFDFDFAPGSRIGLVGANGIGKTTLVKLITGTISPGSGKIAIAPTVVFNYVDQLRMTLDPEKTVYEEISEGVDYIAFGYERLTIWTYLKRFLFEDERIKTQIKYLSGGERARLALAKVLKRGGNFLILDEPTNDLDLPTLRMLEEAVANFSGCVLAVSHDRYFLNRICTGVLSFDRPGELFYTPGDYDNAREKREERRLRRENAEKEKAVKSAPVRIPAAVPVQAAEKPVKLTWKEARELEGMEERILANESRTAELEALFCQQDFFARHGSELPALQAELEELKAENLRLYARWEELEAKKEKAGNQK